MNKCMPVTIDSIPPDLAARQQWVLWRAENGTKIPFSAVRSGKASSTDSASWSNLAPTYSRYYASQSNGHPYSGIGFVFADTDPYCGIDLDGCRHPETGEIAEWAQSIIDRLNTYGEVSPSGTGVKLFARGKLPSANGKKTLLPDAPQIDGKAAAIELYDRGRYFAVTGQILPGLPSECRECQPEIDAIWAEYFAPRAPVVKPTTYSPATYRDNRVDRCRKYVAKMPPAIAGQGGHDATYAVACELYRFGLSDSDAASIMADYNARCVPPWSEHELRHKLDSARETVMGSGEFGTKLLEERKDSRPVTHTAIAAPQATGQRFAPSSSLLLPQNLTDDENGRRFAREHGNKVRYCATWGKWLVWDGRRWAIDEQLAVEGLAKQTNDALWQSVLDIVSNQATGQNTSTKLVAWGKYCASVRGSAAMLSKASSEPGIVTSHDTLDNHPWLLNVENGTIDLRSGSLRPHDRGDLLTKVAPVVFDDRADAPKWCKFVHEIMGGNRELVRYLRSLAGYWLTGVVRDHILPLFIGKGANGKSVFIKTIQSLLGQDYAIKAAPELLLAKRHSTHPTELADLFGKRLVCAIEIQAGRRLAESLIKELTGGDRIRARRMNEDFWEFDPTHKIVLAANDKPIVKGQDNGIWRRLRIVPFDVVIPVEQQNKKLPEELLGELPGILNWALLGCAEWQTEGLGEPQEVMTATESYKADSDLIGQFIADCCIVNDRMSVASGQLFAAYKTWCDANGIEPENSTVFGRELSRRGIDKGKSKNTKVRCGIALIAT